ncbi:MAG: NAD-binding protein [Tissierellales bacterium]|nr:NAD-binding protein [Tissierellales bacterium]
MNIIYKIRKKFCGFRQKYKFKTQIKYLRKLLFFIFVIWLFGSFLTIISQGFFFRELHETAYDYFKYFWYVIIELVSGFDIPADEIPLHPVSQIISIFMLIMGIVVVGLFSGQIISMFVHVLQRTEYFPEKPDNFQFDSPIILCGDNPKLYNIIRILKGSSYSRDREIVIVDKTADKIKKLDEFDNIWYVNGDPNDRHILEKAVGKKDCRAIIFAKHTSHTDSAAIATALAIEEFAESVHTVIEIPNSQNISCYEGTKVNDWINVSEFSLKLISQSVLQPGMAKLFSRLISDEFKEEKTNHIYFSSVPLAKFFIGKTYRDIFKLFVEKFSYLDLTLIGFAKYLESHEKREHNLTLRNTNYFIQINPVAKSSGVNDNFIKRSGKIFFHKDTCLTENDKLIYLAKEIVDFEKIASLDKSINVEK